MEKLIWLFLEQFISSKSISVSFKMDGLPWKTFIVSRGWILIILMSFSVVFPWGWHFWFSIHATPSESLKVDTYTVLKALMFSSVHVCVHKPNFSVNRNTHACLQINISSILKPDSVQTLDRHSFRDTLSFNSVLCHFLQRLLYCRLSLLPVSFLFLMSLFTFYVMEP